MRGPSADCRLASLIPQGMVRGGEQCPVPGLRLRRPVYGNGGVVDLFVSPSELGRSSPSTNTVDTEIGARHRGRIMLTRYGTISYAILDTTTISYDMMW